MTVYHSVMYVHHHYRINKRCSAMICEIIQGFKKFGWNKKNKDISSSKNKAFARLQWITKKDRGDI